MRVVRGLQEAVSLFERERRAVPDEALVGSVRQVIQQVRSGGDRAVLELTQRFDGVKLDNLRVPLGAFSSATQDIPPSLKSAIRLAALRVRDFYENQPKGGFIVQDSGGVMGQLIRPLERVACYVPGGQAPLFSTLLMTAIPAQVAGVREVVVASPPDRRGLVAAEVLAAAREVGLSTVYRMGGPVAVAALAYGTESVQKVDKIVGPGSRLTMLAKQLVYGDVGIEALPGPTETLIIADAQADVNHVVADLLAQAEHAGAQPVLVTDSAELLARAQQELDAQLGSLPNPSSARESVTKRGVAVLVASLQEAAHVANAYAPEHLCLLVGDPWAVVPLIQHAGGLFIGPYSLEALGDYVLGPSHVMPTGGTARFSSAINLRDFQRVIPFVNMSAGALAELGPPAALMARAEGLEAHARAIESRLPQD